MSVYTVRDSRDPSLVESVHEDEERAIAAAVSSGLDVYVHADDCNDPTLPLGAECPCHPTLIKAQ